MKKLFLNHTGLFSCLAFGLWVFFAWRLLGMPSPGFTGRLIPGAWLLAGLLSGRSRGFRWMGPLAAAFTVSAWLWAVYEPGWVIASAIAAAGLIAWGVSAAVSMRAGVLRGILPMLVLALAGTEVTSDEVRFAEVSVSVTGIASERFDEAHFRHGDISPDMSHHNRFYPLLIAPGLLAGDWGLRLVPVLVSIMAVFLLARAAGPGPAVAGALLYPGFSTLGLAMTGWPAAMLLTVSVTAGGGKRGHWIRAAAVLLLLALKMRYAALAGGIILAEYACTGPRRGKWLIPLLAVTGLILLLAVDRYLLGGELFWARYGYIESLRLVWINVFQKPWATLANAGWSLLDPEGGLFTRAPWVIASLYGLALLRRKSPSTFVRLVIPSVAYWIVLIVWQGTSWHGLPAPAGRVFLPMVPMFVYGLAEVWKRSQTRLLLVFSAGVSALVAVYPHGRWNYADGADTINTLLGVNTGFSMVRSSPYYLLAALIPPAAYLLIMGHRRGAHGLAVLLLAAASLMIGLPGGALEAEHLGGEYVQGALLYPRLPDATLRYYWHGSRERMLEMSQPGHSIILRGLGEGSILSITASSEGGSLMAGDTILRVETPLIEMPEEYRFMGRREHLLPDRPENRRMESFEAEIPGGGGTIRLVHAGGEAVYIDALEVL